MLETYVDRCAITTWYYSASEREEAVAMAATEMEVEAQRIRKEIASNTGALPSCPPLAAFELRNRNSHLSNLNLSLNS